MKKGITKSGFVFEFDESRLDDMRFIDAFATAIDPEAGQTESVIASSKVAEIMLGKDLKAKLYKHIGASHSGRVPPTVLFEELNEIMASAGKDAEKN